MNRAGLFALVLLFGSVADAQQAPIFQLHHYGPEHGLSNRHVTALLQDDIGFVWVGSVSGLDRFDGHGFRNWSMSDGLSGGRVDALRHDAAGFVWVFSTAANNDILTIDLVDPLAGKLRTMADHFGAMPLKPREIIRVGPQRTDGVLIFGASSPARCVLYRGSRGFKVMQLAGGERFEPLGDDGVGNIIGHLVLSGGDQQLIRLDTTARITVLQTLEQGTIVESLISGRTTSGAMYRTTTTAGVVRYFDTYSEIAFNPDRKPVEARDMHFMDPVRKPLNITPLPRSGLLVEDARILDQNDRVLFDLAAVRPEVVGRVKDCIVDKRGNPWFATEFGLFHVEIRGEGFERLLYSASIPEGYGILCRGMAWNAGRLYLSTEWQGAYVVETAGDSVQVEHHPNPEFLFATHVSADGTWWRGGPQVVQRDGADGSHRTYVVKDRIWSILDDVDGGVLLGGLQGFQWLDAASGSVHTWNDPAYPELEHTQVMQLTREAQGTVLAVTSKGIYRLGAGGKVSDRWWSGAQEEKQLPYDDLHHCYVDQQGIFWISTRGAGLVCFDPATGKHQQYSMRNGFPNNMVYAAYEDKNGQLWLPTDGGIVQFDKHTRQSVVFTTADGITHDEFNRLAHAQAPDGRLFFGGLNGLTAFDPAQFKIAADQVQHPLVFTSLMRFSAEQGGLVDRTSELSGVTAIHLDEADRSIRISFALLSFEGSGRVRYAWRLRGIEDEWTYQLEPYIKLDRLPFGAYTLEVRARDGQGQWSERTLSLDIDVATPLSAQVWIWFAAGGLCAVVLVVIGLWLGRRRASSLRDSAGEAMPLEPRLNSQSERGNMAA